MKRVIKVLGVGIMSIGLIACGGGSGGGAVIIDPTDPDVVETIMKNIQEKALDFKEDNKIVLTRAELEELETQLNALVPEEEVTEAKRYNDDLAEETYDLYEESLGNTIHFGGNKRKIRERVLEIKELFEELENQEFKDFVESEEFLDMIPFFNLYSCITEETWEDVYFIGFIDMKRNFNKITIEKHYISENEETDYIFFLIQDTENETEYKYEFFKMDNILNKIEFLSAGTYINYNYTIKIEWENKVLETYYKYITGINNLEKQSTGLYLNQEIFLEQFPEIED